MNCLIDDEQEKANKEHDNTRIISTLSELIDKSDQNQQQPPITLRSPPEETETENTYVDEFSNEFSEPIDIVTENDMGDHEYHEEENEISDDTDNLESEFIQHETEPLLQDIANQIMHLIDQSSTTVATDNGESTPFDPFLDEDKEKIDTLAATESESFFETKDVIGENKYIEATGDGSDVKKRITPIDTNTRDSTGEDKRKYAEKFGLVDEETKSFTKKYTEPSLTSPFSASEDSSTTESSDYSTTQAVAELTSRTKIIEPNAQIASSTIENFLHVNAMPSTSTMATSIESSTKDIRRE